MPTMLREVQYLVNYDTAEHLHELHDLDTDTFFYLPHIEFEPALRTYFTEDQIKKIIYMLSASYELLMDLSDRHVSYAPRKRLTFSKVAGTLISPEAIEATQDILSNPMITNKQAVLDRYTEELIARVVLKDPTP